MLCLLIVRTQKKIRLDVCQIFLSVLLFLKEIVDQMFSITGYLTLRQRSTRQEHRKCTEFDAIFPSLPFELKDHYNRVESDDEYFIATFTFHSYARVVHDYVTHKKIVFGRSERLFTDKWWLFDHQSQTVFSLTTLEDQNAKDVVPFATLFQWLLHEERARIHCYYYSKRVNGVDAPSPPLRVKSGAYDWPTD